MTGVKPKRTIMPIAVRPKEAAAALGIGDSLFQRLVKEGHLPSPVQVPGSTIKVWDFQQLHDAFEAWSEKQVNEWDEVTAL